MFYSSLYFCILFQKLFIHVSADFFSFLLCLYSVVGVQRAAFIATAVAASVSVAIAYGEG